MLTRTPAFNTPPEIPLPSKPIGAVRTPKEEIHSIKNFKELKSLNAFENLPEPAPNAVSIRVSFTVNRSPLFFLIKGFK